MLIIFLCFVLFCIRISRSCGLVLITHRNDNRELFSSWMLAEYSPPHPSSPEDLLLTQVPRLVVKLDRVIKYDRLVLVYVGAGFESLFKIIQGCAQAWLSLLFLDHPLLEPGDPLGFLTIVRETNKQLFFKSQKVNCKHTGGECLESSKTHWFAAPGFSLYSSEPMHSKAHQVSAHWDRLHKSGFLPVVIHHLWFLWETEDQLLFITRSTMNKTNESPKPHSLLRSSFLKPRPQMQSGNAEGPVEKSLCFVNTLEMTDSHLGSDFSGKSKFNWHINWAGVYLSEKKNAQCWPSFKIWSLNEE